MLKKRKLKQLQAFDYILLLLFIAVNVVTIYPFLNVLAVSLNDPIDTVRNVNFIIPRVFTFNNYAYIFKEKDLWTPLLMSIGRTLIGTLVSTSCTAMLAYVLSRKDFYFNKFLNIYFIITMYVAGGMIPEYLLLIRTLQLGNKFMVYILPGVIGVFNVILIRSFIDGLPNAIQESAKIDGANDFVIWLRIIMPLCKPVLATVALFVAVGQWNSFMDTYLYAKDLPTLQYRLYEIMSSATMKIDPHSAATKNMKNSISPLSVRMAVTVIATVPILIVYPFLQKHFVGGITLGAVKD